MKWAGLRSFFVVLLMAFAAGGNVSAAGTAPNDANDLEEAAGMVDAQSASISAVMKLCEQKQPKYAYDFHMADYVWHADNHDMVLAEKRVLGNAAERALQPLIERGIDEIEKGVEANPSNCVRFSNALITGSRNVKTYTPRAYGYLIAVYEKAPDLIAEHERQEVETGCVKGYSNRGGRNFEKALGMCRCTRDAIYTALTDQERQDMFAHSGDPTYMQKASWSGKLRKKGQACMAMLDTQTQ